jgi:hypothetical protein
MNDGKGSNKEAYEASNEGRAFESTTQQTR